MAKLLNVWPELEVQLLWGLRGLLPSERTLALLGKEPRKRWKPTRIDQSGVPGRGQAEGQEGRGQVGRGQVSKGMEKRGKLEEVRALDTRATPGS